MGNDAREFVHFPLNINVGSNSRRGPVIRKLFIIASNFRCSHRVGNSAVQSGVITCVRLRITIFFVDIPHTG